MFWIKWAFKNLIVNQKRTLGMITLTAAVLIIIITDLTFLAGTSRQMQESIRNNRGDLNTESRGSILMCCPSMKI